MANYIEAISFIKEREGGLSNNPHDTASSNPSPWTHAGKSDWHTNKGVTYTNFVNYAAKLGYAITADNFFVMPDGIWGKIFKTQYWDKMQLDNIKSEAIAVAIVDFAFNAGVGGATKSLKKFLFNNYKISVDSIPGIVSAINATAAKNEEDLFNKLLNHRKAFYISLSQPKNEKGWLKRVDELKNFSSSLINKIATTAKNNSGALGLLFFLDWLQPLMYIVSR